MVEKLQSGFWVHHSTKTAAILFTLCFPEVILLENTVHIFIGISDVSPVFLML